MLIFSWVWMIELLFGSTFDLIRMENQLKQTSLHGKQKAQYVLKLYHFQLYLFFSLDFWLNKKKALWMSDLFRTGSGQQNLI